MVATTARMRPNGRAHVPQAERREQFSDTFTLRDDEFILEVLYGLFTTEQACRVRVLDPFVGDTQRAPMVTPLMLAERIESLIGKNADA